MASHPIVGVDARPETGSSIKNIVTDGATSDIPIPGRVEGTSDKLPGLNFSVLVD